LTFTSNRNI